VVAKCGISSSPLADTVKYPEALLWQTVYCMPSSVYDGVDYG